MDNKLTNEGFEICINGAEIVPSDLLILGQILSEKSCDIVIAGSMLQKWRNNKVKKNIVFEQNQNRLHPLSINPPQEPGPFLKERWNPFNSFFICKKTIWRKIPEEFKSNPGLLLKYSVENNLDIFITNEITAINIIKISTSIKSLKDFLGSNYFIRKFAIHLSILYSNIKSYIFRRKERELYYQKIHKIKEAKEIILSLNFGGLGDCLSFSTLPRLLKEQYNVDFYLDYKCKNIFRHQDIFDLCFGLNPFFKGFKESSITFTFTDFIQDLPFSKLFSALTNETAIKKIERQFNLQGKGLPEIYYQPKRIPSYSNTLFCDNNWYSGQKWGLYNDQNLLSEEISKWLENPSHTIEYCQQDKQNIFEYTDKLFSAGRFLCLFSGGNALAATLNLPVTVIVPENLEGTSLSLYLFTNSNIKYIRNNPLDAYYKV